MARAAFKTDSAVLKLFIFKFPAKLTVAIIATSAREIRVVTMRFIAQSR